jgi:hypothetical protein
VGEAADQVRREGNTAGSGAASAAQRAQAQDLESADTGKIRNGIEQTRSEMSQTIDALQDKLDPARIAEQVKEQLREKATDAYETAKATVKEVTIGKVERVASSLSETVGNVGAQVSDALQNGGSRLGSLTQQHPLTVAAALAGTGAALLAFGGKRTSGRKPSRALRNKNDMPGGTSNETVEGAWPDHWKTTHGRRSAGRAVRGLLQDKPLVVGFAALTAGAILGISLPGTEWEDDYLGETRQRLFEHAQGVAQEATHRLQEAASEAGKSVVDSIRGEMSRAGAGPSARG